MLKLIYYNNNSILNQCIGYCYLNKYVQNNLFVIDNKNNTVLKEPSKVKQK